MEWDWPQFVVAGLIILGLGISLASHGKPRSPHNLSIDIVAGGLNAWLLYMGGFWS